MKQPQELQDLRSEVRVAVIHAKQLRAKLAGYIGRLYDFDFPASCETCYVTFDRGGLRGGRVFCTAARYCSKRCGGSRNRTRVKMTRDEIEIVESIETRGWRLD